MSVRVFFGSAKRSIVMALCVGLVAGLSWAGAGAQTLRGTGLPVPRFVSLASDEVNVRYGPGQQYPIRWTFTRRALPVKITAEFDTWRKIEDHEGEEGWIHSSLLSSRRTVMVMGGIQELRRTPQEDARSLLRLEEGVIAELIDCQAGWCLIEAAQRRGWIESSALWGVIGTEGS